MAEDIVRNCKGCQFFSKQIHLPASALKTIPITWPFAVWCLDMVGPFKTGQGEYDPYPGHGGQIHQVGGSKPIKNLEGKQS
jgi:hypothetical protein